MKNLIKKIITLYTKCECTTFHIHKHLSILECKNCGSIEFTNSK
jgi:hypothetical protein